MSTYFKFIYYIREADGTIRRSLDPLEFEAFFASFDNRQIDLTRVGKYRVSTIFLGIDHGWHFSDDPILFETMVFSDDDYDSGLAVIQKRYATEEDARIGHSRIVDAIRENKVSELFRNDDWLDQLLTDLETKD